MSISATFSTNAVATYHVAALLRFALTSSDCVEIPCPLILGMFGVPIFQERLSVAASVTSDAHTAMSTFCVVSFWIISPALVNIRETIPIFFGLLIR